LEMLKAHGGVKECNEETITYINEVSQIVWNDFLITSE
jgi:hypothetical protein